MVVDSVRPALLCPCRRGWRRRGVGAVSVVRILCVVAVDVEYVDNASNPDAHRFTYPGRCVNPSHSCVDDFMLDEWE